MIKIIKEREAHEQSRVCLEDQLYDLRIEANHSPNPDLIQRLNIIEVEVRRRERMQAHLWRICSRSTWIKICSAYFFQLVIAKRT